jgi:phenylpropionate dioxygenase-like ring-hydroxylating dioxygenase large terminal subunit
MTTSVPTYFPALEPALLDPDHNQPDALDQTLQPFGRSRMLPAAAYTSPDVLAWERRHLFAGTWTCVGRAAELSRSCDGPVHQRALVVGDVPVLITWPGQRPRAWANTCRHRGHELLGDGESSGRRSIVCPYHAWSYDLTGALQAAPGFRDAPDFDPGEHSLVELPCEVWQGWVFVHAANRLGSAAVPDFAEHIGDLDALMAPYDCERLVQGERHTYEVSANWKVVTENYHECYHCPLIHPELCQVTPPNSGDNYNLPGAWVGGSMDLREGMATMSLTGKSSAAPLPGVDPRRVFYFGLLPNLLLSPHPDYVMAHRMVPLAPDRTWIECSWYFRPDRAGEVPDPAFAVEFWDLTNRQDWAACESVQRGLASPHFRPGPLAPNEDAVHEFVTMIGRAYRGQPLVRRPPTS